MGALAEGAASAAAAGEGSNNDQVIELLASLEARVDLMSQMQQTRAALQQRAQAMQQQQQFPAGSQGDATPSCIADLGGSLAGYSWQDENDFAGCGVGLGEEQRRWCADEEDTAVPTSRCTLPLGGEPWNRYLDQQDCISRLTGEVDNMRSKLYALEMSGGPAEVEEQRYAELEQNRYCGNLDDTQPVPWMDASAAAIAVGTTNSAGPLPSFSAGPPPPPTSLVTAAGPLPRSKRQNPDEPPEVSPFDILACGANLDVTNGGFTLTRARGCRQAAAIGSAPLEPYKGGRYFEVMVEETVAGWVGGLGIGVTSTPPQQAGRIPDKAWRLPKTFIIGYTGCIYLDGSERSTSWCPDTLNAGARVGLLISEQGAGDLVVFVDGQPVVRVENTGLASVDDLYPVVDIFAATRTVTLSRQAAPPPPPWRNSPEPPAVAPAPGAGAGVANGSSLSPSSASRTVSLNGGSQKGVAALRTTPLGLA